MATTTRSETIQHKSEGVNVDTNANSGDVGVFLVLGSLILLGVGIHASYTSITGYFNKKREYSIQKEKLKSMIELYITTNPRDYDEALILYNHIKTWDNFFTYSNKTTKWLSGKEFTDLVEKHPVFVKFMYDVTAHYEDDKYIPFSKKVDSRSPCVICTEDPANMIILNCMHVCLCDKCSKKINKCPICRSGITEIKKAYIV